jgi:o-succinylbenzoate---CoA ligase
VPLEGVRVRIDDGRVMLGGATLAKGYRNPSSPDPFAEPGWFRTDDAGGIDAQGVLRVYGRLDEAISTGGLTMLPQVVEAALMTHPAVAQCAVFGLPDDRLGQRVAAAVVAVPGVKPPALEELRTYVTRVTGRHAARRELHVIDELPLRGIGMSSGIRSWIRVFSTKRAGGERICANVRLLCACQTVILTDLAGAPATLASIRGSAFRAKNG